MKSGDQLTPIVKQGDIAPSGNFIEVLDPSLRGNTVAFTGFLSDPKSGSQSVGIFLGSGGPLTTLVKTGDAAPVGTFSDFDNPSFDGSQLAFQGTDEGGPAVYKYESGTLTSIARVGEPAPSGTFDFFPTHWSAATR
jgi:hypothetical protein